MTSRPDPLDPALDGVLEAARAEIAHALSCLLDDVLAGTDERLAAPIRYAVEGGGKRLRPVLCLAAYEVMGGRCRAAAADLACALELIHTYSLVHDDLPCMDDDDLRRGRPTAHRAFGVPEAILAGVSLIPLAAAAVLRAAPRLGLGKAAASLVGELCAAAGGGGMVGGQWLDLEAEGRVVTLAELTSIHGAKTGALLAAAPRLGALAAGAPPQLVAALGDYGRHLGLAFQIADDLLDVTGTDETLGKTAGRDQVLRKATFPGLLGLAAARDRARAEAQAAEDTLRAAGIAAPVLEALARYAVERQS